MAQAQTPALCRMVIFAGHESNGQTEHPAVITSVGVHHLEDHYWIVNLCIFIDGGMACPVNSVFLFANKEAALASLKEQKNTYVAYWPERS